MCARPTGPPGWPAGSAQTSRQGSRGLVSPRHHGQVRRPRLNELWSSYVPIRPVDIQLVSVLAASVSTGRQVIKVRVMPTDSEAAALDATLNACNSAASWLSAAMYSAAMYKERVHRKYDAHKHFYTELRARFGLSAQPAVRVIGKVADAYASLRANLAAGRCGPPGSPRRNKVVIACPARGSTVTADASECGLCRFVGHAGPQRSDQHRHPRCRTLGRRHASTRKRPPWQPVRAAAASLTATRTTRDKPPAVPLRTGP
jgi:hypothetical protein